MKNNITKYGSIVAILALLIVVMSALFLKKNMEEEHLENYAFYQYLSGTRFEYVGNLTIRGGDEITDLTFNDIKVNLDSTPLYYLKEKKALFPKTMSVTYPLSNSLQYKANYFSRVNVDGESIYLLDGDKKSSLSNCFLYDGKDLYFFIEETTIKVKDEEIKLPPLSYVIVSHNDVIQIYNYNLDQFRTIELDERAVMASASGYTINLSIDAVIYNNKSRLLIKNMDYLKNLK